MTKSRRWLVRGTIANSQTDPVGDDAARALAMIDFGVARLSALSTAADLSISRRDRRILELATAKVHGATVTFGDAMRALREAVEQLIPDGRVFHLGLADGEPIIGSVVSGVGIVERESGIQVVRVQGGGNVSPLGWFSL